MPNGQTEYRQDMLNSIDRRFQKTPYPDLDPWLMDLASDISKLPLENWWQPLFRKVKHLSPEFRERGEEIASITADLLRTQGFTPEQSFLSIIQTITNEFPIPGPFEQLSTHEVESLPLEDILAKHPEYKNLGLVIPPEGIAIKGGGARAMLKLAFDASPEITEPEFPLSDVDYVVTDPHALSALAELNDIINMELKFGYKPKDLVTNKDVNMNSCVVTHNELIFTTAAAQAVQTGHIKSNYHSRRGFYGEDFTIQNGYVYPLPMQTFRLMKLVAEGRAYSFEFPQEPPQGLESTWLGIFRRYRERSNFPEIAQKYFVLAQQMGIPTVGEDFMDTVEAMYTEYPYYPMTSSFPPEPTFYLLSKVIPHIHDWYLADKTQIYESVSLPTMNVITVPENFEVDAETFRAKHTLFESRLK